MVISFSAGLDSLEEGDYNIKDSRKSWEIWYSEAGYSKTDGRNRSLRIRRNENLTLICTNPLVSKVKNVWDSVEKGTKKIPTSGR